MKLGELSIQGSEARVLAEVVLVDACLNLHETLQELKAFVDELSSGAAEQYLTQYKAVISRCVEKLAKLIGLLQLDSMSVVER